MSVLKRFVLFVGVLGSVLLLPAAAWAQASITGVVKDTSGAAMPGVTVEAASPSLIEKTRVVVTDGSGQYRIVDLRPGTYSVTFTLAGFATVKREGVELTGSFVASIGADMKVGAMTETVVVSGVTPLVDVQSTKRQSVLDHEIIDNIPTGRNFANLAVLIPGVTATGSQGGVNQDVGGSTGDVFTNLVVHGSRSDSQRVTLNGVSAATLGQAGQGTASAFNVAAYREVTIDTSAPAADMAEGGVRVNFVPRDGGNRFSCSLFATFANDKFQGNNFTQDLKDRLLGTPNSIERVWDFAPSLGGPVQKDKLWFFLTGRYQGAWNFAGGMFDNLNADNPNAWTYVPNLNKPSDNRTTWTDQLIRFTWQATAKNRLAVSWDHQTRLSSPEGVTATTAPEAANVRRFPFMQNLNADWTVPLTNRLLFDATVIKRTEHEQSVPRNDVTGSMISVTDQATGITYRGRATYADINWTTFNYRATLTYVTGAHSLKLGFNNGTGASPRSTYDFQPTSYRFNNGVPNQITLRATPTLAPYQQDADLGFYLQDWWTYKRMTLSAGVRYDYFKNSYPEQTMSPVPLAPKQNFTLPATTGVTWHDVTPKLGVAFDVFGTGRTVFKVTLNKYLSGQAGAGPFGTALSPFGRLVTTTTRSWNDSFYPVGDARRGNFVPDCDLTAPTANAECGAMASSIFGTSTQGVTTTYDPETLSGFGKRPFNWEFSTSIQHEIMPRVAIDLGFFRRWYGNFSVTDNLAVAPTDYTQFSLPAPTTDSRLPASGSTITGLFDLVPTKFGVPSANYVTFASNYGKQIEHWNGVDVNLTARPGSGLLVGGGFSTGRTVTDNCAVATQVPESLLAGGTWTPLQFCHQSTGFLTQVKGFASYTVPKVDVRVSATFQSLPGPQLAANYTAAAATVTPYLGRALSGNAANLTVNVVDPGTLFGERLNQLDVRVGKLLRIRNVRATINADLYNLMNASTVLTESSAFATWRRPQVILTARYVKFSLQLDF